MFGSLLLLAGIVFLLSDVRAIHVNTLWVCLLVFIGTGFAFLAEWRFAKRRAAWPPEWIRAEAEKQREIAVRNVTNRLRLILVLI